MKNSYMPNMLTVTTSLHQLATTNNSAYLLH